MNLQRMKRLVALSAVVLGLVLQAEYARASAFRVSPVQVQLSGKSSALLTLSNESGDPLRFQITAFAWNQSPSGEMQLAPTDDISFFPSLVTLKPGEERKVRVGSNVIAGEAEKTYRIFFEELPDARPVSDKSQIRILTKMGIPIFVEPLKMVPEARVGNLKIENGRLMFGVSNAGNSHYSVQHLHVQALDSAGKPVFERDLDGWYVLAGGVRDYSVEFPADACLAVRSVKVEALTDITAANVPATVSARQTFSGAPSCKK
jgi:fimbrial chaperone protein